MKVRQGFVSNSSSSSFVIAFNSVELNDVSVKTHNLYGLGKYLSDGR